MHAERIMTTDIITCSPDDTVAELVAQLNTKAVRMIPVIDEKRKILGVVHTLTLLSNLIPEYIVKGDLESIPYAPDMGLLRKNYADMLDHKVSKIMVRNPTIVQIKESLLSVAASLITYDRFEYALVADKDGCLVGVISVSDILKHLSKFNSGNQSDA